jgi:hypothetical protein
MAFVPPNHLCCQALQCLNTQRSAPSESRPVWPPGKGTSMGAEVMSADALWTARTTPYVPISRQISALCPLSGNERFQGTPEGLIRTDPTCLSTDHSSCHCAKLIQ